jgi:hypothetical protein
MGSRSFFHYTDLVSVVSGSSYVCLDPMLLVSDGGGFKMNISDGRFAAGDRA